MAEQGFKPSEIAQKMGLKRRSVLQYGWLYKIPIEKEDAKTHALFKRYADRREKIVDYVRKNPGVTRMKVAALFGVDTSTVRKALVAAGLPTTRQYDENGNLLT